MVLLGGDAGLRLGEIVALNWSDVDLASRRLSVERSDWRGHVTAPKRWASAASAADAAAHRGAEGCTGTCVRNGCCVRPVGRRSPGTRSSRPSEAPNVQRGFGTRAFTSFDTASVRTWR